MEQNSKTNRTYLLAGIFGVTGCIAFDQFTKYLAVIYLKNKPPLSLISGVFELSYLENRGAAFGILQGQKLFLVLITAVMLSLLVYIYLRIPRERYYRLIRLTLTLLISGAIGNLIDRCRQDFVIDFFYFSLIDFPVFNVADIYVTAAAGFLFFFFLFYYKEEDIDLLLRLCSFRRKKDQNK